MIYSEDNVHSRLGGQKVAKHIKEYGDKEVSNYKDVEEREFSHIVT